MTDSLASKAAKGTASITELVDRTDLGECPDNFSEVAQAKWEEVSSELVRLGTADSSLRSCLARLCQDHELIEQAHRSLMEEGVTICTEGPRDRVITITNPYAAVLSSAGTRYQAALAALGLTVASQSKIKPKAATEAEDPIQKQLGKYD